MFANWAEVHELSEVLKEQLDQASDPYRLNLPLDVLEAVSNVSRMYGHWGRSSNPVRLEAPFTSGLLPTQ